VFARGRPPALARPSSPRAGSGRTAGTDAGKAWNDADAEALIDEDPRSYKDIDQVMDDQQDLVAVHHTLSQILNYMGV